MTAEIGWESGLGMAIQLRRVELGMSRKDLAARAGISYPFLSELEKGTKQPSSKKLGQLAEALEIGTEALVTASKRLGDTDGESPSILTCPELPEGAATEKSDPRGGERHRTESGALAHPRIDTPDTVAAANRLDSAAIQSEIKATVENAVSDTLRIWSRDVLPLLVEREVLRALGAERARDER